MNDGEENAPVPSGTLAPNHDHIPPTALDENNEILYVRNTRLAINRHLLADGRVPDDPEKLDFLLKNLKDMDNSAIARSRIKSDEKNNEAQNDAMRALVGQTLQAMRGGRGLPPENIDPNAKPVEPPQLPADMERSNFVPGEMQIGTVVEDVDSFKKRMNAEYEKTQANRR